MLQQNLKLLEEVHVSHCKVTSHERGKKCYTDFMRPILLMNTEMLHIMGLLSWGIFHMEPSIWKMQ